MPLLALLALLGIAGIVLGLLFGLGVIGGKHNNQGVSAADQPVSVNGV